MVVVVVRVVITVNNDDGRPVLVIVITNEALGISRSIHGHKIYCTIQRHKDSRFLNRRTVKESYLCVYNYWVNYKMKTTYFVKVNCDF